MRTNWPMLALLMGSVAAGAASKTRKPRPVKDIRDLGNREFAIDIVLPVRLPTGNRTTTVDYGDLDSRAATYACGTRVWTILGEPERRIGGGGRLSFNWTLNVRCDVAPQPEPPRPKPDGEADWDYRFELRTAAGTVRGGQRTGVVEMFGARNELRMYDDDNRVFATRFSSDGKRVDVHVASPPGVSPAEWTLGGPLTRGGRKECDWLARVEDGQGSWVELVQPGGACR